MDFAVRTSRSPDLAAPPRGLVGRSKGVLNLRNVRATLLPKLGVFGDANHGGSRPTRGFGVFELDLRAAELRKRGVRIKLQEQPFQILCLLLDHSGQVVTRDELRHKLWPAHTFVDFDRSLNKAMTKLRSALGDSAESPRYVETIPRHGYRFLAHVYEHHEGAEAATFSDGPPGVGRSRVVSGEEESAAASNVF